ncbi:MAG: hypothetical protein JKX75_06375 [Gammaproteobacteria bacterium]|nr:hypothetical protein [Gammaproteobacteria bacterium]
MKKELTNPEDMRKELNELINKDQKRVQKAKLKGLFKTKNNNDLQVPFLCAQTGKAFILLFGQKSKKKPYIFKSIKRVNSSGTGENHQNIKSGKTEDIDLANLPLSDFHCPWCRDYGKHVSSFIKCGVCKEYVCDARSSTLPSGKRYFRCHDACGAESEVHSTLTSIKADMADDRTAMLSKKSLPKKTDYVPLPKK